MAKADGVEKQLEHVIFSDFGVENGVVGEFKNH